MNINISLKRKGTSYAKNECEEKGIHGSYIHLKNLKNSKAL
jgi:hypothetical protein